MFIHNGSCDCCDKITDLAVIDFGIYRNYTPIPIHWNVCKNCLQEFVYQMCTEKELRKLKLDKLNEI
jgi:hypothetical protein